MIPVLVYTDGREERQFTRIFERRTGLGEDLDRVVRPILDDVRTRGDVALYEQTVRHDGVEVSPERLRVPEHELEEAYEEVDPALFRALRKARDSVQKFHQKERAQLKSWRTRAGGVVLGQDLVPIERVGVYGPGGQAAYPSSLIMAVVPARVAGVGEVFVVTPPRRDGTVHPAVRVAARECGVNGLFRVGGAQAIGALAYGTRTVPRVDKIVGPGNVYVQSAKRLVFGHVGVDRVAGPSELVVLADRTANPKFVAADLLAQAEHDPRAMAICITDTSDMVSRVLRHVKLHLVGTDRQQIAEKALREHGAIIMVDRLDTGIEVTNRIAPEMVELLVRSPAAVLRKIRHAGAVFVGPWSPTFLGDYIAGPSHVLPTAGTARFASALGVEDFLRRRSYVSYTRRAMLEASPHAARIALAEGLTAHARSGEVRQTR
ncbi:MAG: histidinol dehydrogenase [Candidatus Eisenbacteria bacterium]